MAGVRVRWLVGILHHVSWAIRQYLNVCFLDFLCIVVGEVGEDACAGAWRTNYACVNAEREVLEVGFAGVDFGGGLEIGESQSAEGEEGFMGGVVVFAFF